MMTPVDATPSAAPDDPWRRLARRAGYRVAPLAVVAGLTPRTLRRRIRRAFGTAPEAWLVRVRMDDAPALIRAGLSTKHIAYELGYRQPSHFCRHFQRHYGLGVQAWRRREEAAMSKAAKSRRRARGKGDSTLDDPRGGVPHS